MEALLEQLIQFNLPRVGIKLMLHLWIRLQTVEALVCGMCFENTKAIRILVVLHQVVLDFIPEDENAAYWIEYHLTSIVARVEARGIGFDVLSGLLSGYLMFPEEMMAQYQHIHTIFQQIATSRPKTVSSFTNDNEKHAWIAYYVGRATGYVPKNRDPNVRFKTCITWLQRSLKLAFSDKLKLRAAEFLGSVYMRFGDYDPGKATECFRMSKNAAVQLGNNYLLASGLYKLGRALCESEDFGEAHIVEKQLTKVAENSDDKIVKACAAKLGAYLAMMIGDTTECISYNMRVVALLQDLPVDLQATQKTFLQGSLDGPSPARVADTTRLLSDAWDQLSSTLKDPRDATHAHLQHMKLYRLKREDTLVKVRFLKAASMFHLDRGRLNVAEAYAAELLEKSQRTSLPYSKVHALLILADICIKYHEGKDQSHCFLIVKSLLDEAEMLAKMAPKLISRVLLKQGLNYNRGGYFDEAIGKFEEDARKSVELDENFGSFSLGRVIYKESRKNSVQLLSQFLGRHPNRIRRSDALIWAEREKGRDLLYNLRYSERRYSYLDKWSEFDRDENKAWEEIKDVTRLAGQDTMILVLGACSEMNSIQSWLLYWDVNDNEICFGSYCSTLRPSFVSVKGTLFATLVQMTVDFIRNGGESNIMNVWYSICIEPYEAAFQKVKPKKLVIIPHEELAGVPFAAICKAEGEEYLIQKYALSISPSLRMYKECTLRQQKLVGNSLDALVIGNPSLGENLPSAEGEANYVTEKLQVLGFNVTHFQGSKATKSAAMAVIPEKNWIHIASHAVVDEKYPYGALLLGSDQESITETAEASGETKETRLRSIFMRTRDTSMLTGEDLESMQSNNPLNAMAVVLSACSSGLGRIYSEGVLGLTRSFHTLGVPSVVASLWNVDDFATRVLMEKFYLHLAEGLCISVALQKAIVEMIEDTDEFGSSQYEPYHWATFFVCGTDVTSLTC